MRKLIFGIFLFSSSYSFSQYSNYYNIQKTVDVNQKVSISGNINTIDYGSLAIANAQREKNRLELQKYNDEREKEILLSIAKDPIYAYEYGESVSTKIKEKGNFKKFVWNFTIPHKALFDFIDGGKLINVSVDGITTEINLILPLYDKEGKYVDVEKISKMENLIVGQLNEDVKKGEKIFVHKKDLSKSYVFGVFGFKSTIIWEDDYQFTITDNYRAYSKDGIAYGTKVRYFGNKNETNFEKIEGRRYYMKRLIDKLIANQSIADYKFD